jgi:hypothetical protein
MVDDTKVNRQSATAELMHGGPYECQPSVNKQSTTAELMHGGPYQNQLVVHNTEVR